MGELCGKRIWVSVGECGWGKYVGAVWVLTPKIPRATQPFLKNLTRLRGFSLFQCSGPGDCG